jgi:DNA helicase HerA-like ATPase
MIKTNGKFYLGRTVLKGKTTDQPLLYDPDDLTTHALVVGMTGSGKTGLVIDLLEEAALNNIPALMIDPKGDITNALLHFPDLLPADFQPWVNPDDLTTHAENVPSLLTGSRSSRRVSTSLTKRRLTAQAKADIEESVDTIEELEADLAELAEEIEDVIEEVENKWADIASEIEEIPVTPFKKDILIDVFGVAWMPYHVVEVEGKVTQIPGFKSQ